MSIFSKVITSVFGKKSDKDLKKILPIVEEINIKYDSLSKLSDDELKLEFQKIKDDLQLLISSNKDKYLNDGKDANTIDDLLPFLITVPLQKLAYHSALNKGYDIDKPRNLAKSVTVE